MQTTPFKHAMAMMNAISAMMQLPAFLRDFASLGEYKSRGHGKHSKISRNFMRPYQTNWQARGIVHGAGKKECARRVRQAAKLALQ